MQKGFLIVSVYLETVKEPVANATVTINNQTFITNLNGKTQKIKLEAPDKKYSVEYQHKIKPYSTYDITVTKPGLNTVIIKDVEVFPGDIALQDVYMAKKPGSTDLIDLPEHDLWEETVYQTEDATNPEINPDARILPSVIIPEFLRVKNGAPTSNAAVLTVPFIDYIKNVASSEIYSTWHPEAIKANVHAIVSFTLNRVFTEWYPSRGFNFTITSSPAFDQAFVPNRTIFQSIANIVDQYFREYIRLNNTSHPFFAQYNDGRNTNIPGRLSQWGSQNMALQGSTAIQILRRYYTNNLALHTANQVVGLPSSFPGFNLRNGSCGEFVQQMQIRLNRIRGNFPAIPAISPTNGQYEESTRRAVEAFQRAFNIPVTGIVDIGTWSRISNIFTAVAGLQHGV